mmetsp:Transcript_27158/g.90275  ORF Transcript_27158/g.90275 Transcript_27158/m.90275 type:complete len:494 (-) Transcript_27158:187-1668(-)
MCWSLLFVLLASLLGDARLSSGAASAAAGNPRYVLCPHTRLPSVAVGAGQLRVFAASVFGNEGRARDRFGRSNSALALRAALLVDDAEAWKAELPTFGWHNPNAGHSGTVSYAKCMGSTLPEGTIVGCRVGGNGGRKRVPLERNESDWWQFGGGRIVSFRNTELQQDFAHCVLGSETVRWRRTGPPARLHVRLAFQFVEAEQLSVALPLELCRVDEPVRLASFCSQPLYGLARMQRELPWAVDDWLEYHLGYLGFELGEIYDIDGSLEEALGRPRLEKWVKSGRLVYRLHFAANLSGSFEAISKEHPYCAETWAYAHCLTTHRALSRFVMLLHAPDEYVVSQRRPEERGLLKVLLDYQRGMLPDEPVSLVRVGASSFARGGPGGADDARDLSARGGVVATSRLRGELRYLHTPVLDPTSCISAGPHTCYSEAESEFPGLVMEIDPEDLVVHHYVEMLARNVGRCKSQHKWCDTPDFTASHLVRWLRERGQAGV